MAGILDRDHIQNNLLDRIDELERRLEDLERAAATGLFPGGGTTLTAPGGLALTMATEDLEIVDAGSAGATEQGWVEVELNGVTGYVRVFAGK